MIVIGELINAGRKAIGDAILNKDAETIQKVAKAQKNAGAHYIDLNAGAFDDKEVEYLKWLVKIVQEAVSIPCCIESANPKAIEAGLDAHKGIIPPMINSISFEKDKYDALLPLIKGTNFNVVSLCMSDEGMPETTRERLYIAEKLINGLMAADVPIDNIYIDPLVQPVSTNVEFGLEFIDAVAEIKEQFRGVRTICGVSNISLGLPNRKYLNQTFAVMAIARGLDSLIINPLDKKLMANLVAAESLAGRDPYCNNYLKQFRKGLFDV